MQIFGYFSTVEIYVYVYPKRTLVCESYSSATQRIIVRRELLGILSFFFMSITTFTTHSSDCEYNRKIIKKE